MTDLLIFVLLFLVFLFGLMGAFRIANESERFAVFVLGRFHSYKGPGLVIISPSITKVARLKIGDIGTLTSSEFARFGEIDIPVSNTDSLKQGQAVRIDGFDGVEPRLVASSIPAKTMCPKCGHSF